MNIVSILLVVAIILLVGGLALTRRRMLATEQFFALESHLYIDYEEGGLTEYIVQDTFIHLLLHVKKHPHLKPFLGRFSGKKIFMSHAMALKDLRWNSSDMIKFAPQALSSGTNIWTIGVIHPDVKDGQNGPSFTQVVLNPA